MSPGVSLPRIERRIWDLLVLVSEQQVTQTLGEIRLRRQDIHRKLLDTSLYAAIIRFICHKRDLADFSLVINRVAGRSILPSGGDPSSPASPFAGGARRVPVQSSPGNSQTPYVTSTRRNTIIGRYRHQASTRQKGGSASSSTKKRLASTNRTAMGRQDRVRVRDMLRAQSGDDLRKLMRQSDQRGVAGKFGTTMSEVRESIRKKALGGRGIGFEEAATSSRGLTKDIAKSIKSPDLRRRLLRHAR